MTMAGINVRDVTDVDRRTARRLGMTPEKVNEVIGTWAEEYLNVERDSRRVSETANQHLTTPPTTQRPEPAKRTPRKAAAKTTSAPKKAAAKRTVRKAASTPTFDHKPDDGHDYIPVSNRDDADCVECGAKNDAHPEENRMQVSSMSTADAEAMAGEG